MRKIVRTARGESSALRSLRTIFLVKSQGTILRLGIYSHLSNNRGGWNKRGGEAKIAKSLNVEAGINVEVGIYL